MQAYILINKIYTIIKIFSQLLIIIRKKDIFVENSIISIHVSRICL